MPESALLNLVKSKKYYKANNYGDNTWNHPNRIAQIALSGALTYAIDKRAFTGVGLSATLYEYDLDFSLTTPYTRVFETRTPWLGAGASEIPSGAPAAGGFVWAHRPARAMWAFEPYFTAADAVVIGTCTATPYTRATYGSPWVAGSSTSNDISFYFFPAMSFGGYQPGGEPDSGGKGDGSDDEKVQVRALLDFSGTNSGDLNLIFSGQDMDLFRLPWDDSWSSETAIFSTGFSNRISDANAFHGGGHSGTCSISMDFT